MKILIVLISILQISILEVKGDWTKCVGEYEGEIQAIAVQGLNVFAVSLGGGVYRSTNYGESWHDSNSGLTNKYV